MSKYKELAKVERVIMSCKTPGQLAIATKMSDQWFKKHNVKKWESNSNLRAGVWQAASPSKIYKTILAQLHLKQKEFGIYAPN